MAKDEAKKDRLATVLYNLLESIRFAAVLLSSYMPETAEKILDELSTSERDAASLEEFGNLECGHTVDPKPEILFARIDVKEFMKTLEEDKKKEAKENNTIKNDSHMKMRISHPTVNCVDSSPQLEP